MAVPTSSWDETSPAGSDALNQGDNSIRLAKTSIREVIDVDHKFASSGTDADNGCHDQVTLLEKADLGTGAVGKTILGSQTVSGKGELVYTDEDNNDIQITNNGKLKLSSGRLENNTSLIARNAADSSDVNVIKVNASNIVEIPTVCQLKNSSVMESSAAPTTDAMIVNKKYVDDQIIAHSYLGSWGTSINGTLITSGASIQANTDGFIMAYNTSNNSQITIFTDSSNPPTTKRVDSFSGSAGQSWGMCPVKKNDYVKVVIVGGALVAYWIPLGS